MRIVTAGAHGQIARQFGRLVAQAGHDPIGIVRKPEQVPDLNADGVEAVLLDLEDTDVEALTEVVRGADAVVFAAGGGPDGNAARKETVDKGAAERSERTPVRGAGNASQKMTANRADPGHEASKDADRGLAGEPSDAEIDRISSELEAEIRRQESLF